MATWARKRAMNAPFNKARTTEDRKAWRQLNAQAEEMLGADSSLWAAWSKWHAEGYRSGFKAGFPTFPEWLARAAIAKVEAQK